MKHISIFFFLLSQALLSSSQVTSVAPVTQKMSQGIQNGFKVLVPEGDQKEVQRAWEKLMKEYGGKTSKVQRSDDLLSTSVLIPSVEDTAIDIYSNFNPTPEGVYLSVFVKSGTVYYDYSSSKSAAIQAILKKFATQTAHDAVAQRLDSEAKDLEKLEKDKKNLEKDKASYEKEIKRAKETIEKREKDLIENSEAQKKKQSEIIEKKKMINKTKAKLGKFEK